MIFILFAAVVALLYSGAALTIPGLRARGAIGVAISVAAGAWAMPHLERAPTPPMAVAVAAPPAQAETANAMKAPDPPTPPRAQHPGVIKVCLSDDVVLPTGKSVTLPATTLFDDDGTNEGKAEDPASWHRRIETGSVFHRATIEVLEPVTLSKDRPCVNAKAGMVKRSKDQDLRASASANHIYSIDDVIDYPIPTKAPSIEMGKLIDDISVNAVVTEDIDQWREGPASPSAGDGPQVAAYCLASARKLARAIGASVGRQTTLMVEVAKTPAKDASLGCGAYTQHPFWYVAWQGSTRPAAKVQSYISKSASTFTGATSSEIAGEVAACIGAALKDDGEQSDRQIRGVKIECQAFARDGGGGSVTIYRRFGASPASVTPSEAEIAAAVPDIPAPEPPVSAPRPTAEAETSTYFIGTAVRVIASFVGCPQQEDLDKVKEMIRDGDRTAAAKAAERGRCVPLDEGATGTVKDHSVWHASTCLRPNGEPDCLWVPDGAIRKSRD